MTKQEFQKLTENLLFLDGATGSNLMAQGMPRGICTERWVIEHRDVIQKLQKSYIEAGSRIIYAPTFGGNRLSLKQHGLENKIQEINSTLVSYSREIAGNKAFVAGDITTSGQFVTADGEYTYEDAFEMYKEQITILKNAGVDLIAAEDTRNSIKLLNHFEIQTPMTSYHEYNKFDKGRKLVEKLEEGLDIAVITDAGTPGISDPGEELVKMCYETGIRVTSVPGPAACVTALTMSGLPTRRFAFEAFLPTDKKEREEVLKEMAAETRTIVMYEAPHRLVKTLKLLSERLGDRKVTVCRELTKRHETAFQSTLEGAVAYYEANDPKGECVIVIAGRSREEIRQEEKARWEDMSIEDHMEHYISQGLDRKEAMKKVAKDRGVQKREIYNYLEKQKS